MTTLMAKLHLQALRFANDKKGVTALEYGLMGALIAAALVASVTALRGDIVAAFNRIGDAINP